MATCCIGNELVVFVSKSSLHIWQKGRDDFQTYKCERLKSSSKTEEKDGKSSHTPVGSDTVLAYQLSRSGRFFAACDDYKQLTIWDTHNSTNWTKLNTRSLVRRATSITFDPEEKHVILASKSGDVYRYPRDYTCHNMTGDAGGAGGDDDDDEEGGDGGELLLGHVSMVLDLALMGRYLATCDRDDKIRVSHYPNSYNIHTYLLAHTEFVSKLVYVEDKNLLLSAGGDCTVRLWNTVTWKLLSTVDLSLHIHTVDSCDTTADADAATAAATGGREEQSDASTPAKPTQNVMDRQREKSKRDVKCLCYDRQNDKVVVSFEGILPVLVFDLSPTSDEHLTYIHTIEVDVVPTHLTFDPQGHLWLIQPVEGDSVQIYSYSSQSKKYQLSGARSQAEQLSELTTIISSINQQWCLFKDAASSREQFPMLHKPKMDNVKQYLETKHQRIAEMKKQRNSSINTAASSTTATSGDNSSKRCDNGDSTAATSGDQPQPPQCKKQKTEATS